MNKPTIIGYLCAVLAAACFGSVSAIAKPVVSDVHPLLLSSFVYLIAAAAFTPIVGKKRLVLAKKDYGLITAIAVCGGAIAPFLFFLGLQGSSASDTALLSNGEIVFSVLIALVFFKEKLKPLGFVSVILVLLGLVMVTSNFQFSFSSLFIINSSHLLILAATVFWALDNNLSKIMSNRMDVSRMVQLKSAIGGTILFLMALFLHVPIHIDPAHVPYIILLGVLGFAMSLYFFLHSLRRIGTVRTIIIFSMSSVFGLVFAWIFLREPIGYYQILAIAIMLFGIYLINRRQEPAGEKDLQTFGL